MGEQKADKNEQRIWQLFIRGGDNRVSTISKKLSLSEGYVDNVITSRLKEIEKRVANKANENHKKELERQQRINDNLKKLKNNGSK